MKSCLLLILVLLSGCSSRVGLPQSPAADRLTEISLNRTLFTTDKRMISYIKDIGRLSLIDIEQRREIWSMDLPGYDGFFPLPNADGASLYKDNEILIVNQTAQRVFSTPGYSSHFSAAKNAIAYSFGRSDGQGFRVIRHLQSGDWQEESFELPWVSDNIDQSDYPKLFTAYNHDGTLLLAMNPGNGRYLIYRSNSDDLIRPSDSACDGKVGDYSYEDPLIRSLVWHESLQKFMIGDSSGIVYAIDPNISCPGWDDLPQISLQDSFPILAMAESGNQGLLLGQPQILSRIIFGDTGFQQQELRDMDCEIPSSLMQLDTATTLISCYSAKLTLQSDNLPLSTEVSDTVRYLLTNSDEHVLMEATASTISGVAVDPDLKELYFLRTSSLGIFEVLDLESKAVHSLYGIFLDGLLD